MLITNYPCECVKREALNLVRLHAWPVAMLFLFYLNDLGAAVGAAF
jgi:hypothetical protein